MIVYSRVEIKKTGKDVKRVGIVRNIGKRRDAKTTKPNQTKTNKH